MIINFLKSKFIKFCISGGVNAIIAYAIYSGLLLLHFNYLIATTVSFIIGVLFSYTVNSLFIFHQKIRYRTLLKYGVAYGLSYFINMLLMYILVSVLMVNQFISPIVCMAFMAVINYFLVKKFALKS